MVKIRLGDQVTEYQDTGCSVSPLCRDCPLPACRYDVLGGLRVMAHQRRYREIVDLWNQGVDPSIVAEMTGAGIRTVYRAIHGAHQ